MKRTILVADRDPVYAQALARRIRKHCPACDVTTASDEPAFQAELARAAGDLSLVVSAAHFPVDSLPFGVSQLILLESHIGEGNPASADRPMRLGPVQPILSRLEAAGQQPAEPDEVPGPADVPAAAAGGSGIAADAPDISAERPLASADKETARPHRVILMLTQTITGRHPSYADQRCLELSANGEAVSYLPLMPSYYCRFATGSGAENGFGLTNLILRISGGGMTAPELGPYMAVDSLGRMQVRPSDRADDLLECLPHQLFQLAMLVRERALSEPNTRLVIEVAGIPFRSLQAVMPLCDAVEAIMPDDEGFAGRTLRRELGEALAELPAGARITQVSERQLDNRPVTLATSGRMSGAVPGTMNGHAVTAASGKAASRDERRAQA